MNVEPAVTLTPLGVLVPLYDRPAMVMRSKYRSVENWVTRKVVVRRTLKVHRSLLPWLPGPSVMQVPELVV